MRIKARMLVPRDEEEEDEEAVDPRAELVRRLLEYREFKRVAETLGEREEEWRGVFRRIAAPLPEGESDGELDVSLLELFRAFHKVLAELDRAGPLEMETEEHSVEERMDVIREECARRPEGVPFSLLFEGRRSRSLLITTFLALLELVRAREIIAHQVDRFGEIWLQEARGAAP
jgi:segregation and condensation protein A